MSDNLIPGDETGLAPHQPYPRPVPIPDRAFDEGTQYGLCMNHEWLALVTGACETLLNLDTWDGENERQHWAVNEVLRILSTIRECESAMTDECCNAILDRLDLILGLLSAGGTGPYAQIRIDLANHVINNTVTEIHPLVPDTSWYIDSGDAGGDDVIREIGACIALWNLYTATVRAFYTQAAQKAFTIPAEITVTFGPLWGGLAFIASGLLFGAIETVLADTQAVKNLLCCIPDELAGEAVNVYTLIAAIRACEVGGNETLLGELLVSQLSDPANFGLFLMEYGQEYAKVLNNYPNYSCPCDSEEGVTCDQAGTVNGYDFPAAGGSGWTPDETGGACQSFGTILVDGGDFQGSSDFCLHTVELRRFFGGTSENEAVLARLTVNGAVYEAAILAGQHTVIDVTPHQLITSSVGFRVDLIGGGGIQCYTGMRFTGVPVP